MALTFLAETEDSLFRTSVEAGADSVESVRPRQCSVVAVEDTVMGESQELSLLEKGPDA